MKTTLKTTLAMNLSTCLPALTQHQHNQEWKAYFKNNLKLKRPKKIPKNVRFNRAYDQTKVKAENLSKYNTERFLELMEAVKTISNSIRDGFPQEL